MKLTFVSAPKIRSDCRGTTRVARLLSLLIATLVSVAAVFGDLAIPPLHAHVTDTTGTLAESDRTALEARLVDFEQRKGSQIAVLIIPTTRPETIEQYGIRVAEAWKLGRNGVDDGAILIVAKDDHRLRIEVGFGFEGALTDAIASRIISDIITPEFKRGNFVRGIELGLAQMMAVIDGEVMQPPAKAAKKHGRPGLEWEWPTTAKDIAVLVGVLLLSALVILCTGAGMSVATGSFIAALVCAAGVGFFTSLLTTEIFWSVLAGLLTFAVCFALNRWLGSLRPTTGPARRASSQDRTESSWSGSSTSSDSHSSSSSSSSDSYSGGGGSFGGGGASGSW